MTALRWISFGFMISLLIAAGLNYVPGITDADGRAFGVFALDIYDDLLHLFSAIWAGAAAFLSHRASRNFLLYFGLLYFADGLMGLVTGSGYLDLGIINYGWVDLPFGFKILANLPHLGLGGIALLSVALLNRERT